MQPAKLDSAIARVLAHASPHSTALVPVAEALGGVLAISPCARWQLPLADTSTMDGYAVRAGDLQSVSGTLRLHKHSESAAGHPSKSPLGALETARISTGALLPPGADAVVAQEDVIAVEADAIVIDIGRVGPIGPGHFVRKAGSEVQLGEALLQPGIRLAAPELALLAGCGHAQVPIHRRPKVSIVCTGDELLPIGGEPKPGQVISTNGMMLAGMVTELGASASQHATLGDDRQATIDGLARAIDGADVLITSGGISVGDHDHVGPALQALGLQPVFTSLLLRPGRPLTFGRLGSTWIFALPGNPASTYVTFELIVRPLLCRLLGLPTDWRRPRQLLRLRAPAKRAGQRLHVVRATVEGNEATPLRQQASGSLRSLAGHNALLLIEPGTGELPTGAQVSAVLIDPGSTS